jgi:outer membrane protein assembly factor BamB
MVHDTGSDPDGGANATRFLSRGRLLKRVKRYYSGVALHPPTICCSAIALTIASGFLVASTDPPRPGIVPPQLVWSLPLNNALTAPPAYDGTRAFFPIEGDRLVAYEIAGGRQLWLADASIRHQPAAGDELLFTIESSSVVARRQDDGAVSWRAALDDEASAPLVWANGWLFAGTVSGRILALRASDGGVIWRASMAAPLHAPPAVGSDRVYLPLSDAHIWALDLASGRPAWPRPRRLGDVPNEILALDRRLFVGSNDNHFYALSASSGDVVWRWPTGADVIGRPVLADGDVYFVSLDNNLRALDAGSGAQHWMRFLPIRPTRGPTLVGETVFISGISKVVHGYRLDGQPAGDLTLTGQVDGAPTFVRGGTLPRDLLLVPTSDIATGTTIVAYARSIEPPIAPVTAIRDLLAKMPGGTLTP